MRVRSSRIILYTAGWAGLTVIAAGVVWWGLGPLLAPIFSVQAGPPSPGASSVAPSLSPAPAAPSRQSRRPPTAAPTRAPVAVPSATPSGDDGWLLIGDSYERTFELEGGKATVRIEDGRVRLVSSQASRGFTITARQPSPDRLVVEFFDGARFYVLDAMWWQNRPYSTLTKVS